MGKINNNINNNLGEIVLPQKYKSKYEIERVKIINELIPPVGQFNKNVALDVGTGVGLFAEILFRKGYKTIGIDLNPKNIKIAKALGYKKIEFKIRNICKLDYPDNFFDLILCLEVIEHIKNHEKALEEIYRITKPNGLLIISTPNSFSLEGFIGKLIKEKITGKKWNAWDEAHKKIFSSFEFIKVLRNNGFKIKSVIGYYYLPFKKLTILDSLRYASFSKKPLNYLGFNIIVKCFALKK